MSLLKHIGVNQLWSNFECPSTPFSVRLSETARARLYEALIIISLTVTNLPNCYVAMYVVLLCDHVVCDHVVSFHNSSVTC